MHRLPRRLFSSLSSSSSTFAEFPEAQLPFPVPEGVSCRVTPSAGRSLFATKAFKRGDLIISEKPLFSLRGRDFETWLPNFAALPKDIRQLATEVLFVPSLEVVRQMVPPASRGQSVLPLIESLDPESCADGMSDAERARVVLMLTSLAFCSDALYVFPMLSMANHTCGIPNTTALENALVATQNINPGDELLLNYHPGNLLMDRDSRRYRLRLTKYFHCNCVRCSSGVDWTGALPCPSCNERTKEGLLRDPNGPAVCRDLSEGDEVWRCGHCHGRFGPEDFGTLSRPVVLQNDDTTFFTEFDKVYDLLKAAENLACWSQHSFLNSNYDVSVLQPFMLDHQYVKSLLGNHHWASHILAAIHALHEPSFDALKVAALEGAAWAKEAPAHSQYDATQDSHFNQVLLRLLQHGVTHAKKDPVLGKLEADLIVANLSLPGFS